jgi:hypothetical protein
VSEEEIALRVNVEFAEFQREFQRERSRERG